MENEVLLFTIQNDNKVTSVVSFNKIRSANDPYDITLNSELQTAYSPQQSDINSYVNLNDLELKENFFSLLSEFLDNKELYKSLIDEILNNDDLNMC